MKTLHLGSEKWQYVENESISASHSGFRTILKSIEQDIISNMIYSLKIKSFVINQDQDFDQAPLENTYNVE